MSGRNRVNRRAGLVAFTGAALMLAAAVPAASAADHFDLRGGGVYTMTNDRDSNDVVAFAHGSDGRLTRVGQFPTGGTGSGSFEDTANAMVLGSADGESAPNNLVDESQLLFVTNARSNDITVFAVEADGLRRVELEPSGGEKPVSLTVNGGVLYVLHSGEATDDLFDSEQHAIPNCTTGTPSITGFTVSSDGELSAIAGSTRRLSGLGGSGCAQVSFNPDGTVLVVTERSAKDEGAPGPMGDEGVITTYTRNADGTLEGPTVTEATGEGPFGFTFNKDGDLYTSEQFDGPLGPDLGAAASYQVNGDGTLTPASPSVQNGGTDTCWFVITDDGQYGYTTSFFGDGRISIYDVGPGGALSLHTADASPEVSLGAADISLSQDSRYLYQLNAFEGTINVFGVESDGSLSFVEQIEATGPSKMAGRLGLASGGEDAAGMPRTDTIDGAATPGSPTTSTIWAAMVGLVAGAAVLLVPHRAARHR
jgi:6-phosphogluconolactonase (cycloisomerase 2 family)